MHISCPQNSNQHKISDFWILKLFIDIREQVLYFSKKIIFLNLKLFQLQNTIISKKSQKYQNLIIFCGPLQVVPMNDHHPKITPNLSFYLKTFHFIVQSHNIYLIFFYFWIYAKNAEIHKITPKVKKYP